MADVNGYYQSEKDSTAVWRSDSSAGKLERRVLLASMHIRFQVIHLRM
jgi:hypothetical protein